MGLVDRVLSVFGGGERSGSAGIDVPPVSELLAPTRVMEVEWRRSARSDAIEYGDHTRAELGREFGMGWFSGPLPASLEERRSAVEELLFARSRNLYASHLDRVQEAFDLPDAEVQSRLMVDVAGLPGRDRPLDRALRISSAIIAEDESDRAMELNFREMERGSRMYPDLSSGWAEYKAGEPAVLAAERDGDHDHVDHARRAFVDMHQLKDPSLREIAETVVEKADRWSSMEVGDLSSGQVRLAESTARRLLSSASTYEAGRRRDSALVEAYLEEYAARNPKVVESWNRHALETMSEGPAFMRERHPGVETDGLSVRQVVSLEALRAVRRVRAEREVREIHLQRSAAVPAIGRLASSGGVRSAIAVRMDAGPFL